MTRTTEGRHAGLDLLRVVACLLVVAYHLQSVLHADFGPLSGVVHGGDTGIYLFFALSGFLLYRPFLRGSVDFDAYTIKRSARIVPGYFVALAALALLTRNPLPASHPLAYLSMTATYNVELRGFLGNAWTLSAEILFYLALPVIARLVAAAPIPRLVIFALVSVCANALYAPLYSPTVAWVFGAFPFVAFAFVPGMLVAVVEARDPAVFGRLASPLVGGLGATLVVLQTHLPWMPVPLATGIGAALLIGWLSQTRVPFAGPLAFAGGASYALYLWHKDLFLAFGGLGLVVAFVGAALSWALVERPVLEFAHAVVARRRTIGEAEAAAAVP